MKTIRKATIKDIDQLKEIKPTLTDEHIAERLKRQGEGLLEYLVYEVDGKLASFVLLKWHGKKTHPEYPDIEDLFTKKSQRAKGYGTKLLRECEKLAKEKGFKRIGLAANPDLNESARKLYEKLGYRHDGKESYVDGVYNGVEDRVIDMEKDL